MTGLGAALLSIMMIACFALAAGAIVAFKRRDKKRGLLMRAAAAVILANVLIWTI